ncbi:MAG: trigger factor [bacterium]|nr:trigger factor [bacterium]
MQVNITEESPILRAFEITVEADRVDKAYNKAFKEALRHLALPGFRRGKVPAYMGRKHIPNQVLNGQVAEEVIPEAYREALEQENIRPVSAPKYEVVKLERGEDMVFRATCEVIPAVEIKDYKDIELTQPRPEITDADINEAVDNIRNRRSELVDMTEDRGLQEGDIAFVDFESFDDGKPVDQGSAKNFPMEMDPKRFVPGFLDNLYGKKSGEEAHFEVDFPEDYSPALAGKHVHFDFKIHNIKVRQLPEANDEFAKEVSDFETMDEFKADIRKHIEERVQAAADQSIAEKIYVKISDQVPFELVPGGLVSMHASVYATNLRNELNMRRINLDAWLKDNEMSREDWQRRLTAIGVGEARMEIIVRAIAAKENIDVSDEDMEEVVAEEAKKMHQSQAYVWNHMEKSGTLELLRYSILRDKVTKMLVDAAKVTYCAPGEEPSEDAEKAEDKCCDCAEGEKKEDCECGCHTEAACCECPEGEKKEDCECECHK